MKLLDKIYYFWEDEKRLQTTLYYMIATFLVMLSIAVCICLAALPIILASIFTGYLLFLWIVTIPLCVGVICTLINIVE